MYANLTIQLYRTLDSQFFRVWGAIYSAATLALWTAVFVRTLMLIQHGAIFESPCLEDFDMARAADVEKKNQDAESGARTPCSGSGR